MGYTGILKTLRVEAAGLMEKKRIARVRLRLYKTLGVDIGADENTLEEILFRAPEDLPGEAVPLYTGDKEIYFPGDWDTEIYVYIEHSEPLPMTILAIGAVMMTGG